MTQNTAPFEQLSRDDIPPGFVVITRRVDLREFLTEPMEEPFWGRQYRIVRVDGAVHDCYAEETMLTEVAGAEALIAHFIRKGVESIERSDPRVDLEIVSKDIAPSSHTKESGHA